jgi:glycine/D-amino acid oxidase-like deaminating enzyme
VPDDREALWFPEAGSLLSADLIAGCLRLLEQDGGSFLSGTEVTSVRATPVGAVVDLADGRSLDADGVVVCAGPGTSSLLPALGLDVPLQPFLEEVVHLGLGRASDLPCLFDGPGDHGPGIYAMPTPGVGYKVGIDWPLRELVPGDLDRTPDPERTAAIVERTRGLLGSPVVDLVDEHVCCWTDSPDGWFVVETVGAVVVACGDSGKGFKYSPAMGEILADLAEGRPGDPDVAAMTAQRFAGHVVGAEWSPTSLGEARA